MIPRHGVVQAFLDLYSKPRYLEIGVFQGVTFDRVNAARKIAVDPSFRFEVPEAEMKQPGTTYHEVDSDTYFGDVICEDELFDVIYLDGLHTFEQTLRDLLNALRFLQPSGVIILDDVWPNSYLASIPDLHVYQVAWKLAGSGNPAWMGDVYRLVFFVQSFLQQYSYATVEENHGQMVLWRQRRNAAGVVRRSVEDCARLDYGRMLAERDAFQFQTLVQIVAAVRAAHAAHASGAGSNTAAKGTGAEDETE